MSNTHLSKVIMVTGALSAALVAYPSHADSDVRAQFEERFDLKLNNIVRVLQEKKHDDRRKHATSTNASTTVSINATVTGVSGNIIMLSGKNAAVYTVNAANASFQNGTLATVATGDRLVVKGTVSGNVILATKIWNKDYEHRSLRERVSNLRAGIVTAVSPTGFTITRFDSGASSTVTTSSSTTVTVHGKSTSTITVGSKVIVSGSATSSPDTITASVIHVINKGFGWIKHFFFR